jgi:hypothetical protein
MAAIASLTPPAAGGSFAAAISTLTSSDTITFNAGKKQLLVLRNPTGGSLTLKIDGDGGTTVAVNGIGPVSVSGGYDIVVGAGLSVAVVLGTIKHYCKGVVTLTGASGMMAQLFNL